MGSTRRGGPWGTSRAPATSARASSMLPGVAVTGARVEVPLVAVARFRDGPVPHEHIHWDQSSVLVSSGCSTRRNCPRRAWRVREKFASASRWMTMAFDAQCFAAPLRPSASRHPKELPTGEGAARRRDEAGGAPQMTWCPQLIGVPQSGPTVHGDGPAPRGGHHDGQKTLACEIAKTVSRPWGGGRLRPSGKCRQSVRVPRGR
jgi:hypothetical protein